MKDEDKTKEKLREGVARLKNQLKDLKTSLSEYSNKKYFCEAVFDNSTIAMFVVQVQSTGNYIYEGVNKIHEKVLV